MSILTIPALIDQINTEIITNGIKSINGVLLNKNLVDIVESLEALDSGELTITREFSQSEFRTLNSANGGYGYEIVPAAGAGKVIVVKDAIITFEADGGAFANAKLSLYNYSSGKFQYSVDTSAAAILPIKYTSILDGESDSQTEENDPLYFWADAEAGTYVGKAELIVTYKIIDIF